MITTTGNDPAEAGGAPETAAAMLSPSPRPIGAMDEVKAQPVLTLIREDLTIVGRLCSKGKVILEGTIEGDLHCAELVVGEKGQVQGDVVADAVAVYGHAEGAIYGKTVELFSTADVKGNIFHHGIGIERGTRYDGTLKYLEDPVAAGMSAAKNNPKPDVSGAPG